MKNFTFVTTHTDVCFICKKVAKCHVLFKDDTEEIKVCQVCDLE